jgi:hypothetical protein
MITRNAARMASDDAIRATLACQAADDFVANAELVAALGAPAAVPAGWGQIAGNQLAASPSFRRRPRRASPGDNYTLHSPWASGPAFAMNAHGLVLNVKAEGSNADIAPDDAQGHYGMDAQFDDYGGRRAVQGGGGGRGTAGYDQLTSDVSAADYDGRGLAGLQPDPQLSAEVDRENALRLSGMPVEVPWNPGIDYGQLAKEHAQEADARFRSRDVDDRGKYTPQGA